MADTKNLSPNGNAEHLLVVNHLKKYFPIKKALHEKDSVYLKAVDDVSLTLDAGKTVGIVSPDAVRARWDAPSCACMSRPPGRSSSTEIISRI